MFEIQIKRKKEIKMATLTVNNTEYTLKFSIMLDKVLNKLIKVEDEQQKEKLSGGISKVLPQLIEQDVEALVQLWEASIKLQVKKGGPSQDELLEAIDERMNADDDATTIFTEVFEAIDDSAFSRNELAKFKKNMLLVKEMKQKDEEEVQKTELMLKRLAEGYKEITGQELFEEKAKA
jgi:Phage tail assembly chaperone protein, TAC